MSEAVNEELPEGWEWSTLGDVCEHPQYGWTTKASQEGDLHLLRTTDITSGQINWDTVPYCVEEPEDKEKYLIKDGDIVVSRAGSVGVSYLISNPEPSVFASYLIRFKPLIDRKYVYYFLKSPSYWNAISEKSAGIALQNVNASKLREIDIPVAPPEQQKRIVAKIEELFSHIDAGIEALKKAKQLLKQYRQSVLKAAVTGELTKEWREANKDKLERASQLLERILKERRQKWEEFESEKHKVTNKTPKNENWKKRYKDPIEFDFDDEIELPDEWVKVSLDTVTDLLTDYHANGSYKVLKDYVVLQDEPSYSIYIRSKNFEKEDFLNDLKYVSKEAYEKLWKSKLYGGELVVGKIGNAGRVYYMPEPTMPTTLGMNLFMLRLNKEVNKKYIYYVLKSGLGSLQISRRVKGVGNPTIDKISLKNICIPLPCKKEQDSIVELIEDNLEKINRLEKDIDSQFLNVEKNKQSILSSSFSGEL